MRESGLSDHRIAELAGIPMSTFRRRVQGVNPWTLSEIDSVAKVLHIDPDTLVRTGEDGTSEAQR